MGHNPQYSTGDFFIILEFITFVINMLCKEFYGHIDTEKKRIEFRKEIYDCALTLSKEGHSMISIKISITQTEAKVKLFYMRPVRKVLIEKSTMFNYSPVQNVFKTIRSMNLIVDEEYEEEEYKKYLEQLHKDSVHLDLEHNNNYEQIDD